MKKILKIWLILAISLFAKSNSYERKVQGRLNIVNGASAECVMHNFYTKSGWTQIESRLRPIVITAPRNSFEKRMVQSYNECRRKYLRKYLKLGDGEINHLLEDNYIQKKDIL